LSLIAGEKALAVSDTGPVWTSLDAGGGTHFRSSFGIPELAPEGSLREVLNADRFFELVPLIHWLRAACDQSGWHSPPARACFIIDDPNLHSPRYGYVSFRELAARAAKGRYHVAFATIPIDSWYTHKAAASEFRSHAESISLLIHGNNHTYKELAVSCTQLQRQRLLAQSVQRIQRLEAAAGIRVARVMAPPHGACSEAMLQELPGCGFEAATISHGSLRAYNPTKVWSRTLGYRPSECIGGCPVLPRFGLNGSPYNAILLASFLRQPLLPMGHHTDLRSGVELLDEVAEFINSLGSVTWGDMTVICRNNYQYRLEGHVLRLRPLGRHVSAQLPEPATHLLVENAENANPVNWEVCEGSGPAVLASEGIIPVMGVSRSVTVKAPSKSVGPTGTRWSPVSAKAAVRRVLTETRDRLDPFASRWCRGKLKMKLRNLLVGIRSKGLNPNKGEQGIP
jgi:hypothetical protein